jgi:hypothetical protein
MKQREEFSVTRRRVLERLHTDRDLRTVAGALRVSPGLVFMLATGIPADASGVPTLPEVDGIELPSSPQSLVNHRGHNPVQNATVDGWMQARAARELNA